MTSPALSLPRKLLYSAIAALLGLAAFLGVIELGLRIVGFGYSAHFARAATQADGTRIWRENRWCTAPFFGRDLVRRPQPFVLPAVKPPGTCRIFVLGSSAAMGDPEPSFSLARMLELMLCASFPGQRFEVVNAGITAINSQVLRGIASDCARLEPDLFIVYEGNNEVIGPFGPAGVFASFFRTETAVRLAAWARTTRTGQGLTAIGNRLHSNGRDAEWGGMQMFLQQQIPANDSRLARTQEHFRANLLAIARAASDVGASTLLCTVVTNVRDFAPFLSLHRPDLGAAERAEWTRHFAAAIGAERERNLGAAETEFRAALAIDDQHAELVFRLGRLLLQLGRDTEGRALLQRALDLDALRFRTDSALNQVIREAAATAPHTTLVDLAAELAVTSAHGCPGDDLLYEHVHLNFRGTYEAALHLLPAIANALQQRGTLSAQPAHLPTIAEARASLAYTTYEQAMIGLELLKRFRAAPFTGQIDDAQRVAGWEHRIATANALLAETQATDALDRIYAAAMKQSPDDWILQRNAGAMLVARGRPAEAIPLLERALTTLPDDPDTLIALALAQRGAGRNSAAEASFAKVRVLEPRHPLLPAAPAR